MRCENCGDENQSQGATACASCGAALPVVGTQPAQPPQSAPSTSGMAIASLVLAVLGFITFGLTGIVGVILGIVALSQIGRSSGRVVGNGLAVAGIIVGAFSLLFLVMAAAIMFPVFARAREAAKVSNCTTNLKEIGMGMQMYSNDYDGYLPRSQNWLDAMKPYVKNPSAYRCPSAKAPDMGYAFNAPLSGARTSTLEQDRVLCFDARGGRNAFGDKSILAARHRDGTANVVCADGHVTRWFASGQPSQQKDQPPAKF